MYNMHTLLHGLYGASWSFFPNVANFCIIIIITSPIGFKYFGQLTWHVHAFVVGWLVIFSYFFFSSLYILKEDRG